MTLLYKQAELVERGWGGDPPTVFHRLRISRVVIESVVDEEECRLGAADRVLGNSLLLQHGGVLTHIFIVHKIVGTENLVSKLRQLLAPQYQNVL